MAAAARDDEEEKNEEGDQDEEKGNEEMEAEEEVITHKAVQDPGQPSKAEKAAHDLTHMPFRSWCPHCVRGRGKAKPHFKRDVEEDAEDKIPTVAIDYCFQKKCAVSEARQEKMITTLVMKETPTGSIVSIVAPRKGKDDYVVRKIIDALKALGNQKVRIIIKSDGEPAIKALVKLVQQRREMEHIVDTGSARAGTLIEEAPLNDSASNGGAEKAVQEVEGHVRTWVSFIEDKLKRTLRGKSIILPWLIEYVSIVLNRTKVGEDGKTAYVQGKIVGD